MVSKTDTARENTIQFSIDGAETEYVETLKALVKSIAATNDPLSRKALCDLLYQMLPRPEDVRLPESSFSINAS